MTFLHRPELLPVQKMANTIRRTPRSAYYRHSLKTPQWLVTRLFELLAIIPFPEILSPRLLTPFQYTLPPTGSLSLGEERDQPDLGEIK